MDAALVLDRAGIIRSESPEPRVVFRGGGLWLSSEYGLRAR